MINSWSADQNYHVKSDMLKQMYQPGKYLLWFAVLSGVNDILIA